MSLSSYVSSSQRNTLQPMWQVQKLYSHEDVWAATKDPPVVRYVAEFQIMFKKAFMSSGVELTIIRRLQEGGAFENSNFEGAFVLC